jgi:hypothetical protein
LVVLLLMLLLDSTVAGSSYFFVLRNQKTDDADDRLLPVLLLLAVVPVFVFAVVVFVFDVFFDNAASQLWLRRTKRDRRGGCWCWCCGSSTGREEPPMVLEPAMDDLRSGLRPRRTSLAERRVSFFISPLAKPFWKLALLNPKKDLAFGVGNEAAELLTLRLLLLLGIDEKDLGFRNSGSPSCWDDEEDDWSWLTERDRRRGEDFVVVEVVGSPSPATRRSRLNDRPRLKRRLCGLPVVLPLLLVLALLFLEEAPSGETERDVRPLRRCFDLLAAVGLLEAARAEFTEVFLVRGGGGGEFVVVVPSDDEYALEVW